MKQKENQARGQESRGQIVTRKALERGSFLLRQKTFCTLPPWDGTILWVEGAQSPQAAGAGRKSPLCLTGRTGSEIGKDSDFSD